MTRLAKILSFILIMLSPLLCNAKVKTTRSNTRAPQSVVINSDSNSIDDIEQNDTTSSQFNSKAITIKGFSKRASDWKESFFVTNNSSHKISYITLTLRYTDMNGNMLHERTVTVNCNLNPKETRQIKIQSFDTQSEFYYYASSKPRKKAAPFQVFVHIESYHIPIENPNK